MKRAALFILLISLLCTFASAANADTSISGTHETAAAGETVSITLSLNENPGLAAWKVELNWDQTALELDKSSIVLSDSYADGMFVENSNEDGKLYLVWANTQDVAANGELVILTFRVTDKAASGTYPITVGVSGTRNQNGDKIAVSTEDASITLDGRDQPTKEKNEDKKEDAAVAETPFRDVDEDAYYYDPTMWAVSRGVTTGMSEDTFAPDLTCSRAQTVTFLWRAADSPKAHLLRNPFSDVSHSAYYDDAVLWALEQNITTGMSETEFGPDLPVTRGQVVTFLWRTAGTPEFEGKNPFDDVADDAYYAAAVRWAVENNITTGMSADAFSPDAPCTRSQIVTFLYRYFGHTT